MDRVTRHELKTDKFAEEVMQSVEFVGAHRNTLLKYGGIALAVIVVVGGTWSYFRQAKAERQNLLSEAFRVSGAFVGPEPRPGILAFPTAEAQQQAYVKALNAVVAKGANSQEGLVATFLLAGIAADKGDLAAAEKGLKTVVDNADNDYAAMARQALGELYASEGKMADAEKVLRQAMDKPAATVTKEQATLTLAKLLKCAKPAEAKKLIEPMRVSGTGAASRAAISLSAELDNPANCAK